MNLIRRNSRDEEINGRRKKIEQEELCQDKMLERMKLKLL